MSEELRPCPFCGGKAVLYVRTNGYREVGCESCYIWTSATQEGESENIWNRRYLSGAGAKPCGQIDERGNYSGSTSDVPFNVYRLPPAQPQPGEIDALKQEIDRLRAMLIDAAIAKEAK